MSASRPASRVCRWNFQFCDIASRRSLVSYRTLLALHYHRPHSPNVCVRRQARAGCTWWGRSDRKFHESRICGRARGRFSIRHHSTCLGRRSARPVRRHRRVRGNGCTGLRRPEHSSAVARFGNRRGDTCGTSTHHDVHPRGVRHRVSVWRGNCVRPVRSTCHPANRGNWQGDLHGDHVGRTRRCCSRRWRPGCCRRRGGRGRRRPALRWR
jgi:hypothetical protein